MDKSNEFYKEIKAFNRVTPAEATIAWFYSGKKQLLIDVETRFPIYTDGEYDCTKKIQAAIDLAGGVYLPHGEYKIASPVIYG